MVLIKSETLKVTISVAEQTCLIYKQTALNKKKITLTIQWNLKIKASSAAKPNQHELMVFNNSFAFSNMKDCVQSQ